LNAEKALFDIDKEELLSMGWARMQEQTIQTATETVASKAAPASNRKMYAIQPNDKWWIGGNEAPCMPAFGKTAPLYAQLYPKMKTSVSIEVFVNGRLKEDSREPADYQLKREGCIMWVNKSLGQPETQEELEEKCKEFADTDVEVAICL
jgi:hypothetical protein